MTRQTHSRDCWRWSNHWRCAILKVEEAAELLQETIPVFREACDCGSCGPCQLADRIEEFLARTDCPPGNQPAGEEKQCTT